MKKVVLQTLTGGTASFHGEGTTTIRDVFMPSVRDYCKHYGYDYILDEEPVSNYRTNLPATERRFSAISELADHYDYVAYLDLDILVSNYCPLPDNIADVMMHQQTTGRRGTPVKRIYNTGVIMATKRGAKQLSDAYFGHPAGVYHNDQSIVNDPSFSCEIVGLDKKWNFQPEQTAESHYHDYDPNLKRPVFLHYYGGAHKGATIENIGGVLTKERHDEIRRLYS